uniref:GH18 domain-containing protein n=1 Tax=Cuerna arida TaxID=1464854 RepID=A0A1B6FKC7_9HEMI
MSTLLLFFMLVFIGLGYTTSASSCSGNKEKVVVCYFTNWAIYRTGHAKFSAGNINPSLCTHILYAFASLDDATLTIIPSDNNADVTNGLYASVTALKKRGLKVLISIGGWISSKEEKWRRLIRNVNTHSNFITSVLNFLKKYNFDGLDVDYEYPGCPQGNRLTGQTSDSKSFNKLMSSLRTALGKKYLLTVATAAGKSNIKECFHMTELCHLVDWVNVMTYDYHNAAEGVTGANAPYGSSMGVVDSIMYYINEMKCPSNKIVLGIPFYGRTYTMANPGRPQFGVPVSGPGTAGTYTNTTGFLAYHEICLLMKNGYSSGIDEVNGSYAWKDAQFISYDGPPDLAKKSSFIISKNLRGAMVWALDLDDFNSVCGCGNFPLLTTLNQQLRCLKTQKVKCY